ncbi:MAG TPA: TIGR00341 family protein [Thermoleophilia bacterium]|nr:TIGR00341 family protein [Thermoleophilia bacterium]
MSWLGWVINVGPKYHKSLVDMEDGLYLDLGGRRAKLTKFWVQMALASVIAAGGVIGNSTPAVIGAMIIAPLGTPIYGLALGAVIGERHEIRRSLLLLVGGIAANILIGVLIGLVSANRMPIDVNPQIVGRTAPTMLDLAVAVATGLAGSFALSRKDVSDILAGVAIAISLVPVLAVVGITLGSGRTDLALGAFILFLTNAAAILVAGAIVFTAAGYKREAHHRDARSGRHATIAIAILVVVLVIPLGAASVRTLLYERWSNATQVAAEDWVAGTEWHVDTVTLAGDKIVITVIGPGAAPGIQKLKDAIRRKVPDSVPVKVIEETGRTQGL